MAKIRVQGLRLVGFIKQVVLAIDRAIDGIDEKSIADAGLEHESILGFFQVLASPQRVFWLNN
jgi:hypothetical protein